MSMRPRPILVDMPLHIKEKIVHHVRLKSRYALRGCSKEFRNIVDTIPTLYHRVQLLKGHNWDAEKNTGPCALIVSTDSNCLALSARPDEEDPLDRLLKVLKVILRNPKAHFVELYILNVDVIKLQTLLTSQKHKMSWRNLGIRHYFKQEEVLSVVSVLQCLKPGVLNKLTLHFEEDVVLDQVFDLEQWKQAKSIELYGGTMPNNTIQHVLHLHEFSLFQITHFTVEDAKKIVENALKMGEEFRSFDVYSDTSMSSIEQHFGQESFFDIPESNHKLKLSCTSDVFTLEKMKLPQN